MNFQGFRPSSPPQFRPLNDENGARNVKQTLSGDRLICELERVIEKNENFIDFLSSDFCSIILIESKTSIHVETGNLCYENFNTNDLLLNQQDEKKKIIDATLSYSGSFRDYLTEFLQGIDAETDDRFDTLH